MSQIDFEALRRQFDKGRKTIEVQKLRGKIAQKLAQMVRLNRTRMDFLEEFQKMIDEYNSGASNIETLFAKLMAFTKKLSEEEKRGIAEQLTEEELVIFDLLTKPDIKLTKAEEREVKKVAKDAAGNTEARRSWCSTGRSGRRQERRCCYTIETVLDELPRAYTPELYEQKCERCISTSLIRTKGLVKVCTPIN